MKKTKQSICKKAINWINNNTNQLLTIFICLLYLNNTTITNAIKDIFNYIIVMLFFTVLISYCFKFSQFFIKGKKVWPIITSVVLYIVSGILKYSNELYLASITKIISAVFMEIFLLYMILQTSSSENNNITLTFLSSLSFLSIGFLTIYNYTYYLDDKTLFNSLITIFASIIGGGLTLGGVAWTIKDNEKARRQEEILKIKPYISFTPILKEITTLNGDKICFTPLLQDYELPTQAFIENSDKSITILSRIYHDNKWFELQTNTVLLPNNKCIFKFEFNDPFNIFLEVKDTQNNNYYYIVKVLKVPTQHNTPPYFHTLCELSEITKEKMEEMIATSVVKNNE